MLWRGRGRHRVEDFARGIEDGGAACPDDPRTSRLVGLANALRSVPLRPSPEFTLALRRRIVNAARASCPDQPRSLASLLEGIRPKRGLPSTTVLLTAVVALVSIGFGATQALPGDALYGLKLRGESITIALAHSDEAKGYSYLRFAGARLHDVSSLIHHDGAWREASVTAATREPSLHLAGLVNSTLTTMNGYTDKGAASLRRAYQRTADPAPLAYLDDFTKKQHRTLSGMLGRLPAASQAVAGASLNLVDRLAHEASKLLTEQCSHALACQSQPPPSDNASPDKPTTGTPSAKPATSQGRDIRTSGPPDPSRRHGWQGTSPQRVPSSSQQPPGTTTGPASSDGSKPGEDIQQTSPPSTGTGSSTGSSGGSSTSGGTTDTSTGQPSPPSPTGVPTTSGTSGAGTDSGTGSGSGAQADTSGAGATSDTSSPSSPSDQSGPSGSEKASTPPAPPSWPSDPSSPGTSGSPAQSGPLGVLKQTLTDQPSDSGAAAAPAP